MIPGMNPGIAHVSKDEQTKAVAKAEKRKIYLKTARAVEAVLHALFANENNSTAERYHQIMCFNHLVARWGEKQKGKMPSNVAWE